ncbi:hypothetical protein BJX62DRAFT_197478, partial [Aspergillus germanicus]
MMVKIFKTGPSRPEINVFVLAALRLARDFSLSRKLIEPTGTVVLEALVVRGFALDIAVGAAGDSACGVRLVTVHGDDLVEDADLLKDATVLVARVYNCDEPVHARNCKGAIACRRPGKQPVHPPLTNRVPRYRKPLLRLISLLATTPINLVWSAFMRAQTQCS